MDLFVSIIFSLFGLLLISLIFLSLQRFFKISRLKITLLILFFLSGFIIYFIGYYDTQNAIEAASYALISTTQMLVLNNNLDGITNPLIKDNPYMLMTLSILSVFIFGILAQTLIITLFKDYKTRLIYSFSKAKSFLLIYGYDSSLDILIEDIKNNKKYTKSPIENIDLKDPIFKKYHKSYMKQKLLNGQISNIDAKGLHLKTNDLFSIYVPRSEVIDYDFDDLLRNLKSSKSITLDFVLTNFKNNQWFGSNLEARLKNRLVFIIDESHTKEHIIEKGYMFLSMHKPRPRCRIKKHFYHFMLSKDDVKNISCFESIVTEKHESDSYYLNIQNESIKDTLSTTYSQSNLHFTQDNTIIVNDALRKHPLHETIEVEESKLTLKHPFKAFIGGLSGVGYTLLKSLIVQSQFVNSIPSFDLHSNHLPFLKGKIHADMPEISYAAKLNFLNIDLGSDLYFDHLIQASPYHYVAFTYDDDQINLDLSLGFIKRMHYHKIDKHPIILCLYRDTDKIMYLKQSSIYQSIVFFGDKPQFSNIYDVLQDRVDQYAKLYFHAYEAYKAKLSPNYTPLSHYRADPFTFESNRQVYLHIPIKLKLLGLSVDDALFKFQDANDFKAFIEAYNPHALELLSETEHLRWNAFHYVHGWSKMTIEEALQRKKEIELGKIKGSPTKDLVFKKHICLVSYQELIKLEDLFNAQYRLYDTHNVLGIIETLKA